jgi:hypothetical protein
MKHRTSQKAGGCSLLPALPLEVTLSPPRRFLLLFLFISSWCFGAQLGNRHVHRKAKLEKKRKQKCYCFHTNIKNNLRFSFFSLFLFCLPPQNSEDF